MSFSMAAPLDKDHANILQRLWNFCIGRFLKAHRNKRRQHELLADIETNRLTIAQTNRELKALQNQDFELVKTIPSLEKNSHQWRMAVKNYQEVENAIQRRIRDIESCYANIKTLQNLIDSMNEAKIARSINVTSEDIIIVKTDVDEAKNQQMEVAMTSRMLEEMDQNAITEMDHSDNEKIYARMMDRSKEIEGNDTNSHTNSANNTQLVETDLVTA